MGTRSALLSLFLLALTFLAAAPPAGAEVDLAAAEWNQARGNPMRTSVVDVEPLKAPPQVAWRMEIEEPCSNLVTWGGTVFVVVPKRSARELLAIQAATGEVIAKKGIKKKGRAELAVWQGTVLVVEKKLITAYRHKGKRLGSGWKFKGSDFGPPVVHDDRVVVSDGDETVILDARTGKEIARADGMSGMLSLEPSGQGPNIVGFGIIPEKYDVPESVGLFVRRVKEFGTKAPEIGKPVRTAVFPRQEAGSGWADGLVAIRIGGTRDTPRKAWLVTFPETVADMGRGAIMIDGFAASEGSTSFSLPPAVSTGMVFGFNPKGVLEVAASTGQAVPMLEKSEFPNGARVGAASAARGVLYLGNWAVETETRRVLWCLPDLQPVGPMIPAGDGLIVVVTKKGELLGLTATGAATDDAEEEEKPLASTDLPADDDGVLLADGRHVTGTFKSVAGGKIRIEPTKGKPFEVDESEVLLTEASGRVKLLGDEFEVFSVWRDILDAGYLGTLENLFGSYVKAGHLDECRRLIDEAERHGIAGSRAAEWNAKMTGRRSSTLDEVPRFLTNKEEASRKEAHAKYRLGVDWCRKRKLPGAASVLLLMADRISAGGDEVEAIAAELIPDGFPWANRSKPGRRWLEWSELILPAGATFLTKDDPAWKRVEAAPWDRGTTGFRTRNLIFFSRAEDREVVTACLRNGEGSVRALSRLLNEGRAPEPASDDDRMEVRIHKNRREFQEEAGPGMQGAAGYYTPSENVSRFFVPSREQASQGVERDLYLVLAHELTHHYISSCYMDGESDRMFLSPGFWIVEGMATFLEEQAVEMGRMGLGFDDETVFSNDVSCQVLKQGKLYPMRRFLGMTQKDFHEFGEFPTVKVKLRNTLAAFEVDPTSLFYQQAGSLTFFLLHRAGPEGRKGLIRHLTEHYEGNTPADSWKTLGFDSPEDLEKQYHAFLRGLEK